MSHSSLAKHALCVWGGDDGRRPECDREHAEFYFVEDLTFADADMILAMLRELSPQWGDKVLPVWIRNLAYRLLLLQRPNDPALIREAAFHIYFHGPDWDDVAADLERQADALEAAA